MNKYFQKYFPFTSSFCLKDFLEYFPLFYFPMQFGKYKHIVNFLNKTRKYSGRSPTTQNNLPDFLHCDNCSRHFPPPFTRHFETFRRQNTEESLDGYTLFPVAEKSFNGIIKRPD